MSIGVVTGASRGLGLAITRALAERGWTLVVDARDGTALTAAVQGLPVVTAVAGDVTDPGHREQIAQRVRELGGLDLLVNNASELGPSPLPALQHHPLDVLERVYRVNVVAALGLIQHLMPLMHGRDATVVNITSDAGVEAYEGWGGYGSSKAALDQLTNVLAIEQPDVRFYAFDPGDMRTVMHQAAYPGEDISDRPEPEAVLPALLRLIDRRPPSGRYRKQDLETLASTQA